MRGRKGEGRGGGDAVFHDDVAPEGNTVGRARAVLSADVSSFMGL